MGGHMLRALNPLAGKTYTISPTLASCDAIPKEAFAGGSLGLPAATTITSLKVYTSHDGTNWGEIRDEYGAAITITVTKHLTEMIFPEIPDICFKYPMLKFQSQAGATDEEASVFLTS